ncbi:MAG: hypothetical protein U0637_03385 [Phycisphaerales bacterium]
MKVCAFVGMCAVAAAAQADVIQLNAGVYQSGNGGEFTIIPQSGFAGLTGLPADLTSDSFQSFCVENGENIVPGAFYNFAINTGAIAGGVGGGGFDALDPRTAFLYYNFRMGTLSGFDYSPAGRQASAGLLQNAIWYIEGEPLGSFNSLVALADAAVAPGGAWDGMGIGPVRVLNLSNDTTPLAQDQLTIIPAPATALLLGAGLLVSRRRR